MDVTAIDLEWSLYTRRDYLAVAAYGAVLVARAARGRHGAAQRAVGGARRVRRAARHGRALTYAPTHMYTYRVCSYADRLCSVRVDRGNLGN